MLQAYLMRYQYASDCTRGILFIAGEVFHTLEPPWLNNIRNVSCVPAQAYDVVFIKKTASGRFRNVYLLLDVPERTGILKHAGVTPKHTLGCILIGERPGVVAGQPAILNSASAMGRLYRLVGDQKFTLHITGEPHYVGNDN